MERDFKSSVRISAVSAIRRAGFGGSDTRHFEERMDIEVYTARYEREHGHRPQGRRFWRFTLVSSITTKDHFLDLSEQMTYPDALARALEVARLRKSERIIVEP